MNSGRDHTTIVNNGAPVAATAETVPATPQSVKVVDDESSLIVKVLKVLAVVFCIYFIYAYVRKRF